jgi:hypothetical protein
LFILFDTKQTDRFSVLGRKRSLENGIDINITMGKKEATSTTLCYIKDADYAWVPAILAKTEGDKAYVQVPQYRDEQSIMSDGGRGAKGEPIEKVVNLKDYAHKVLPLQNVDKNGCLTEHADMVKLPYLHEVRS